MLDYGAMEIDPRYLAGVFDSDGSISLGKIRVPRRARGYAFVVLLQLTWKRLPETLVAMKAIKSKYGGSIGFYRFSSNAWGKRGTYPKLTLGGHSAARVLSDIVPYLIVKKRQGEICLEITKIQSARFGKPNALNADEWNQMEKMHREVKRLNAR
jgi:hypothetical protein